MHIFKINEQQNISIFVFFLLIFMYFRRKQVFINQCIPMENIRKALKSVSGMSDDSIQALMEQHTVLHLPKKHILTSSYQKDNCFYFIEKGIARSFCTIDGKEATSWFSMEGDIVFSTNNFYGKIRGYEHETVQLLEDSCLYAIPVQRLEYLYKTNIEIANWSRILHQKAFIATEKRLISRLYYSAEERYTELLQTRPELFQRVNLGHIASYLGISQVTLCHLRNKA